MAFFITWPSFHSLEALETFEALEPSRPVKTENENVEFKVVTRALKPVDCVDGLEYVDYIRRDKINVMNGKHYVRNRYINLLFSKAFERVRRIDLVCMRSGYTLDPNLPFHKEGRHGIVRVRFVLLNPNDYARREDLHVSICCFDEMNTLLCMRPMIFSWWKRKLKF